VRSLRRVVLAAALTLLFAPAARAGGPSLLLGAAEDGVRQDSFAASKAKLDLLRLAGFEAVRVTSLWAPGQSAPDDREQAILANLAAAAKLDGMRVFVDVTQFGSRTTPLTDQDQNDFASYAAAVARANPSIRDIVISNEPNLNRFWLPQFNPDGSDAAAVAYEQLLARCYDVLKAVDPDIRVVGVAVSPRGSDNPTGTRLTHSPTTFIKDIGQAYRASGRAAPIMDDFDIHAYEDNSSVPPTATHPNTTTIAIADYPKLVSLLGQAFDGTGQAGSTLPISYGEFGVETKIPPEKASLYIGRELTDTVKPVDEQTQAQFYKQAIGIAFCQANVTSFFVFHAFDESDLDRWQSGVYYADQTPRPSAAVVAAAARDVQGGVIAKCQNLPLTPNGTVAYPKAWPLSLKVTCDIDCNIYARLEKLPRHSTTFTVRARGAAGEATAVAFPDRRVRAGPYRITVRLTAPVNTGPPKLLTSQPLMLK
jgi:hypothetical protein